MDLLGMIFLLKEILLWQIINKEHQSVSLGRAETNGSKCILSMNGAKKYI